jgi:endonuclease/exonuclease/phosphatase family metal-dependent hydrolase
MQFRVLTLNLEQDHKRWKERRSLVLEGLGTIKPDIIALNEVSIVEQSARKDLKSLLGLNYNLVQQTKVNGLAAIEGEALLTRFDITETANLDYRTRDMVAQVTRIIFDGRPLDIYVTHLYMSRGDDALRLFQVQQLLAWIETRNDASGSIVCGDFNATLDMPSAALMASRFQPTQTAPTAFTPLAGHDGSISHPYWPRMDRCIDYIWTTGAIKTVASGVCFDQPAADDPSLWPSDHAGVWADIEF